MHSLYIAVAALGAAHFLFSKRDFDYFALAFLSALLYFLPGLFGVTSYSVDGRWSDTQIHPEAYAIMIFVLSSIYLAERASAHAPSLPAFTTRVPAPGSVAVILAVAACTGLAGLLLDAGSEVFQTDKANVLESLGRWHILFYSAGTLGFAVAYAAKRHVLLLLFLALLAFDLYIGFRSALSIALLSVFVLMFHARGKKRLAATNWAMTTMVLAFGFLMFGYAHIAFAAKAETWDVVWSTLTNPEAILFFFTRSEPFIIQQTLNEVISRRFETDMDHVLSSVYQLMLFAPELGADTVSFNSKFQPALFPEVAYGLASNIWAQMWSAGGWPLLVAFAAVFNIVLAVGNATLRARCTVLRAGLAPVFCYWAFYIHRNDLGYTLNLAKRHLLLLLFAVVLVWILKAATRRTELSQQP